MYEYDYGKTNPLKEKEGLKEIKTQKDHECIKITS